MPKRNLKIVILQILTAVILTAVLFIPAKKTMANSVALTIIAGSKTYTFCDAEIGNYNGNFYLKNAKEIVDGIYLDTVIRPQNATLIFNKNMENPFMITKEKNGSMVDKLKLLSDVYSALNQSENELDFLGENSRSSTLKQDKVVKAKFIEVKPKIKAEELQKTVSLRAEFSTEYPYSNSERKHNILLATNMINGYILNPYEEFSFNKIVGLRTTENGYKTAKVILNGEYVDGVGGGVCQVSTTLYNSALLAGMKITEQNSHSLLVQYVEPSFDAMVNSYTSDLRFVNTTNSPVYIVGEANGTSLTFKIYGVEQLEKYQRVSVVMEDVLPESPLIVNDETLLKGQSVVKVSEKKGAKSQGYLITYVNGERVKTELIRKDYYNALRGVILTAQDCTA